MKLQTYMVTLRLQGVNLTNTYTDIYTHANGESSIPYYSRKQDKIKGQSKDARSGKRLKFSVNTRPALGLHLHFALI